MQRRAFEQGLSDLLRAEVVGLDTAERAELARRHVDVLLSDPGLPSFSAGFEPFVPGRRPIDEVGYPGLGSSEETALFDATRVPDDTLTFLVRCRDRGRLVPDFPSAARLLGTIEALDHAGRPVALVAGWDRADLRPLLRKVEAPASSPVPPAHALVLDVERTFAAPRVALDPTRYLGFASRFHQRFRITLDVEVSGARVTGGAHEFEIYNEALFGSLYQRMVDVLLPWDIARQASGRNVGIAVHPWYPVLSIGMQKARYYMLAITGDLVHQKRMLADPGWLLRVGLYLELLTCLGVAEAAKDEIDILTPEERSHFENDPGFEEVRRRIDVGAWKKVWALRDVVFGTLTDGPTGGLNLLRKKTATLAFLHAHHEDLKHAIDLAGPNLRNSQETWHRVFRDAERAVLQMNADAFPELSQFPKPVQEFALWHQSGKLAGMKLIPRQVTEMFGDQDGVFPSACHQYRASMNDIAAWARERGLMEYTGDECVPVSASLLQAYLGRQQGRLASLQRHDGYAGTLQVVAEESEEPEVPVDVVVARLQGVDLFRALGVDELHELARGVRPIHLSHLERIIVEGRVGTSLYILQEGTLEVVDRAGGAERQLAVLQPPAVVGEMAFLLGEKRGATVRALDGATVLEVSAELLRPLVEQRPVILDRLRAVIEARRAGSGQPSSGPGGVLASLREAIFGRA